ncbi:MAG: putative selenium-dependent hydroxylase accessory protein YqeC [Chloroflexi bacterium]|nr:putative selenium-dependent hydroxylase accessory protein YqeC [Chloroflexota bacterium]
MQLTRALRFQGPQSIAFAGAGGKSTALSTAARELLDAGYRIISTTTVLMPPPVPGEELELILESDPVQLLAKATAATRVHRHVQVALRPMLRGGLPRLQGISLDLAAALREIPGVDAVLIKADGARGRFLKAPAEYEPAIPPNADVVVVSAGLDGIGRPLTEKYVHRPEIFARSAGMSFGEQIDPIHLARVLMQAVGDAVKIPPHARTYTLLNKTDLPGRLEIGKSVARLMMHERLEGLKPGAVIIGSVASSDPIKEVWEPVGAVVLAAGAASRFGEAKQLLQWEGKPLVAHIVEQLLASRIDPIVVVSGAYADQVSQALAGYPVHLVHNPLWAEGQSTSVRSGLAELWSQNSNVGAAFFMMADQPRVTPELLDRLVYHHQETLASAVIPGFQGRRGSPALVDRRLFDRMLLLEGDEGARQIFRQIPQEVELLELSDPRPLLDIDTPEDYNTALRG